MFDNIFIFTKILLFGKVILLTIVPIDISEHYALNLEKPVSALTNGAHIIIGAKEITEAGKREGGNLFDSIKNTFPEDSVYVVLIDKEGKKFVLDRIGYSYTGTDEYLLILSSSKDNNLPLKKKFYSLEIFTKIPLTDVEIKWSNYTM